MNPRSSSQPVEGDSRRFPLTVLPSLGRPIARAVHVTAVEVSTLRR